MRLKHHRTKPGLGMLAKTIFRPGCQAGNRADCAVHVLLLAGPFLSFNISARRVGRAARHLAENHDCNKQPGSTAAREACKPS